MSFTLVYYLVIILTTKQVLKKSQVFYNLDHIHFSWLQVNYTHFKVHAIMSTKCLSKCCQQMVK